MNKTVLLIEDDAVQRVMMDQFLRKTMGLSCLTAENGRKGMDALKRNRPTVRLVLCDLRMPVMDGMDTLAAVKTLYPGLPVIILTASKDVNDAVAAIRAGADDYIVKPFDPHRMETVIRNALRISAMGEEISRLNHRSGNTWRFNDLIGCEGGLAGLVRLARKAAPVDLPVLITGETGTGKEMIARAVHGESARSGAPFIAVNCGAIPAQLVESTLFGHEKGSFTGASEAATGKFREADGGTLFLDEIGDLPLEAQSRLLRALQEGEVEPVGAARPVKVNVRVIAATHRDLDDYVRRGLFREDLYYRINVIHLTVPPLRDRVCDIPALAVHFTEVVGLKINAPVKRLSDEVVAHLEAWHWPGNVREMENAISRACVLSGNDILGPGDFPFDNVRGAVAMPARPSVMEPQAATAPLPTIQEAERALILGAMKTHSRNATRAARSIGMPRSTFYRKLRALRLKTD